MSTAAAATDVDVVIRGGTLVTDAWTGPGTVLVSGGRIRDLLDAEAPLPRRAADARMVDATGRLVVPGGVDPHCHIAVPVGEYTTRDDYESSTLAALAGGTTTVIDFAIPLPGESPTDAVAGRHAMAGVARCDYALHGCVTEWDATVPDQLRAMAQDGIRTIKMFTTYRGVVMAEEATILRVMSVLNDLGGLAYIHAESNHLVEDAQGRAATVERIDAAHHAETRPELAEDAAVAAVLAIAESQRAPVYFVHQSTPQAVRMVAEARRRGVKAFSETCPHYVVLDSTSYDGPHPERYVCCPPLRDPETVAAVRRYLSAGLIDTIGSDNCCYDTAQKEEHRDDVRVMPNGLPGVETRLPVLFSELVSKRGLPVERFVAITATNPARLNGLHPRKGTIAPGVDADLVVIDPSLTRTVRAEEMHMATDYSPYEGMELSGWPTAVVAGGRVVLEDGRLEDPGAVGRFLPSAPMSL